MRHVRALVLLAIGGILGDDDLENNSVVERQRKRSAAKSKVADIVDTDVDDPRHKNQKDGFIVDQSPKQSQSTAGIFQKMQEKLQQILQQNEKQTSAANQDVTAEELARALQQHQQQQVELPRSSGRTNPTVSVGAGLSPKSRRRMLYEISVRQHYNNGRAEIGKEDTDVQEQRLKIDVRKTAAELIGGGKGEVVWMSEEQLSRDGKKSDDDESSQLRGMGQRSSINDANSGSTMECAYFASFSDDDIAAGRTIPYWSYRLCPGEMLEQFHLDPRPRYDDTANLDKYDVPKRRDVFDINFINEKGVKRHVEGIVQTSFILGRFVRPTLIPNTRVLSDEYRSYTQIWRERNSENIRESSSEGKGILIPQMNDSTGEVSYYGSGDECSKNKYRMARIVTLTTCCPVEEYAKGQLSLVPRDTNMRKTMGRLQILAIDEKRQCRYNVLACYECDKNVDTRGTLHSQSQRNIRSNDPNESNPEKASRPAANVNGAVTTTVASSLVCKSCEDAENTYLLRRFPSESADVPGTYRHMKSSDGIYRSSDVPSLPPFPPTKALRNLEQITSMFRDSYDSYMYNAYPAGELKPLSCAPGTFDLTRLPALTLFDSLDTLIVMNNFTEFARSVERLRELDGIMEEEFSSFYPNFREPAGLPERSGGIFSVDQNVSVFETSIRVLGGLLSAHQMAEAFVSPGIVKARDIWGGNGALLIGDSDSEDHSGMNSVVASQRDIDGIASCSSNDSTYSVAPPCTSFDYVEDIGSRCTKKRNYGMNVTSKRDLTVDGRIDEGESQYWEYDGFLLTLAHDLGLRLLPAFKTETGIPYGTVNLLYGIPPGETSVASLAGGGTLSIEMQLLSRLTGDKRFGAVGRLANRALWARRSTNLDLLGKHIDVHSGQWVESLSGIGSNSDSFYEYLLKQHILFPDDPDNFDLWVMFVSSYAGVFYENRLGDWYGDVDMQAGRQHSVRHIMESLMAFWPGMQVMLGELLPAGRSANAFSLVRELLGLLPERFDFGSWKVDSGGGYSPLRPELLESIYFLHKATSGINLLGGEQHAGVEKAHVTGWQWASDMALKALQRLTQTDCAYAAISHVSSATTGSILPYSLENEKHPIPSHKDDMPSYFIAETLKYLYLTFDDDNILHQDKEREWVFTTEAHPVHFVFPTDTSGKGKHEKGKNKLLSLLSNEIGRYNMDVDDAESVALKSPQTKRLNATTSEWAPQTPYNVFNELVVRVEKTIDGYNRPTRQQRIQVKALLDQRLAPRFLLGPSFSRHVAPSFVDSRLEINGDDELEIEHLSALTGDRLGRGDVSALPQTCVNHHHPDLRWVYALNGEFLDYGQSFITYMSDGITRKTNAGRLSRRQLALSSSASFGVSFAALKASEFICPLVKLDIIPLASIDDKMEPEVLPYINTDLEVTRYDMGPPLGQFDISVLTGTIGFFVRHVNSGVTVEATILEDAEGNAASVMVVSDYPPPKEDFVVSDTFPTIRSSGKKWHWDMRFTRRYRSVVNAAEKFQGKETKTPYQRRKALLGGSNGSSFECTIYLRGEIDSDSEAELGTLLLVPCSPALFGPTTISNLYQSGGLEIEGELILPEKQNEFGCAQPAISDLVDGHNNHKMEQVPAIVLRRRGECLFQEKASISCAEGKSGMIVINSDNTIFVMSGEKDNAETIPSVLVGKDDGEKIIQIAEKADGYVQVLIHLRPNNGTAFLNGQHSQIELPAVSMSDEAIQIYAPEGWGIHAVKKDIAHGGGQEQQQQQQQQQQKQQWDSQNKEGPQNQKNSEWQLFLLQHQY